MPVSDRSAALRNWPGEMSAWRSRLNPVVGRSELRRTAYALMDGLLSGVARNKPV